MPIIVPENKQTDLFMNLRSPWLSNVLTLHDTFYQKIKQKRGAIDYKIIRTITALHSFLLANPILIHLHTQNIYHHKKGVLASGKARKI